MKRKCLSVLLCAAMSAALLAGCGNKEAADEGNKTSSTEDKVTASAETVKLTCWGSEDDQTMLQEMVDAFAAANPDQKFEITIGVQSESTAKDTVLTDIEAAADVFAFADDQLNELVNAGALQAVQDADTVTAENVGGSVEAATMDGILYAYPYTADNGYFMMYNKEFLSEDDVQSLDAMLQKAEESGKLVAMDWSSAWYLYSFFGGAGLDISLNEDGVTNNCNWNATDTAVKGVDVAQAMLDISASPAFKSMTDTEIQTGMADGTVIAAVEGTWAGEAAKAAWGDSFAACKLPTYTCAENQVQMSSFAGYKLIGVNAYSKNVGWAMELAKWLTNEENQTKHFEEKGIGPSNIKAADSDAVKASVESIALLDQSDYSTLQRVGANYWDPAATFGAIMVDGNSGNEDLQTVLDNTVDGITAAVAE